MPFCRFSIPLLAALLLVVLAPAKLLAADKPVQHAALSSPMLALPAQSDPSRPVEAQKGPDSGLPLPRFVSLAADKVNARTGPGSRYPIAWQYQRRGLPVEVVAEYEYWRRIRDRDGTETWVHKNLTSGRRYALVDGMVRDVFKKPDAAADVVLQAEPGVQVRLRKCQEAWCQVEIAGSKGWMPRQHLWGLYSDESFD